MQYRCPECDFRFCAKCGCKRMPVAATDDDTGCLTSVCSVCYEKL
jgi:hypothetical protein